MLSDQVQSLVGSSPIRKVITESHGAYPNNISGSSLQSAANLMAAAWKHVIFVQGLQNFKEPTKPPSKPPLNVMLVMRSLVMLRCIYRFELEKTANHVLGTTNRIQAVAPSQSELCDKSKYTGLLPDMYRELQLNRLGYLPEASCKGPPHIQASAHLLSDTGCLMERGKMHSETGEVVRNPYALLSEGRIFAYYLFGDTAQMLTGRTRGWSGIPPISSRDGKEYSPWLEYVGVEE